jgi:LuxR family transcriptional regulator, maltose regulon positive regulatory protein
VQKGVVVARSTPHVNDAVLVGLDDADLPTGTLTFCFTDIEGSTQLWEQHPQAMRVALAHHDTILRQAIQTHAGVVFKTAGDGVHAAFARAADAVAAAHSAQLLLQETDWGELRGLRVRMALHTGAAELRDGDYFGAPLNRVARIMALGHGGQVLLSHATHDLVADELPAQTTLRALGEYQLKDLTRPEPIFQLISPDLPADFPPLRAAVANVGSAQLSNLLTTKLYVPPARSQLVPRPHLLARLDAGLRGKLTLVSAPAGFGKTTLLAEWLQSVERRAQSVEQVQDAPTLRSTFYALRSAWVSLDAADSDPTRFWIYVIAALDMLEPNSGAAALALLHSPQPPPIEVVLTPLLNALHSLTERAVLVLDDYHVINAPLIHNALAFMLDHLPPRLHLVITSRADPPLPLTRLRMRAELTELRAADLRFTAEETATFLTEMMGIPLSAADVATLETRTEGWIAGLQLAALAMRDRTDHAGFVRAFNGSNRFVVDYLAEEVLGRLPAHLHTFVLQTSVLDRLCGPLCDAVLGLTPDERPRTKDERHAEVSKSISNTDQSLSSFVFRPSTDSYSQLILEELERLNLFLIPLDDERRWYRYHHLFAEVIRSRLISGANSTTVATLHSRASAWYEQQDLEVEAVGHALAAGDWEQAARLIERCAWPVTYQGQIHTVLGWFDALPTGFVGARPAFCTLHAQMLMHTNRLEAAETRLQQAEQGLSLDTQQPQERTILGRVLTTRANISFYRGDLAHSIALGQQALDFMPEPSLAQAAAMAFAGHIFLITGDVTPAVEHQVAAVAPAARAVGNRFVLMRALTLLAQLQMLQGRLHAAAATYREVEQLAPTPDRLRSMIGSAAYYFGLGDLHRERNDLAAAEQLLVDAIDRASGALTANAVYLVQGFIALARLQHARGDTRRALATLEAFADLGQRRGFDPAVLAQAAAAQAQLALARGDLDAAHRWAASSGLHADDDVSFPRELAYLVFACVLIAEGHGDPATPCLHAALALLDRLLAAAEAQGRIGSVIEILVVRALAFNAQREPIKARVALERALTLAEPEGYVRVFVDQGATMAALLAESIERRAQNDPIRVYAERLLATFPEAQSVERRAQNNEPFALRSTLERSNALIEPLSTRELEILRLIAAGHSNQAIADTLIIAVSTVKRHINNIYGKLEVQSRTQALVRARELNLL